MQRYLLLPESCWEIAKGRFSAVFRGFMSCDFDDETPTNHPHAHSAYELCLVTQGGGIFDHAGETFPLQQGDLFIARPDTEHEIRKSPSATLSLIFFMFAIKDNRTRPHGRQLETSLLEAFTEHHRLHAPGQHDLFRHLEFINASCRDGAQPSDHWIESAMRSYYLRCLEIMTIQPEQASNSPLTHAHEPSTLDRAIQYIGDHAESRFDSSMLARHCHTSARNLQIIFKKHYGISPLRFHNQKRAMIAANYLLMGCRVTEVCDRMGIDDPAQFSRFFKQHYGVSPKQYQQQQHATMNFSARYPPQTR